MAFPEERAERVEVACAQRRDDRADPPVLRLDVTEPRRHAVLELALARRVPRLGVSPRDARVDDDDREPAGQRDVLERERPEVEQHRVPLAAERRGRLVEDPTRNAERPMLRPLRDARELEPVQPAERERQDDVHARPTTTARRRSGASRSARRGTADVAAELGDDGDRPMP